MWSEMLSEIDFFCTTAVQTIAGRGKKERDGACTGRAREKNELRELVEEPKEPQTKQSPSWYK